MRSMKFTMEHSFFSLYRPEPELEKSRRQQQKIVSKKKDVKYSESMDDSKRIEVKRLVVSIDVLLVVIIVVLLLSTIPFDVIPNMI